MSLEYKVVSCELVVVSEESKYARRLWLRGVDSSLNTFNSRLTTLYSKLTTQDEFAS